MKPMLPKKRQLGERWKSVKRGFVGGMAIGAIAWAGAHAGTKMAADRIAPKFERPPVKAPAAQQAAGQMIQDKNPITAKMIEQPKVLPVPKTIVSEQKPAFIQKQAPVPKKLVAEKFPPDSGKISVLLPKNVPCISAEFINNELKDYNSPAAGLGKVFFKWGRHYSIRPEVALGFFRMESNFGKEGLSRHTKAIGNIVYTPPKKGSEINYTNYKGFRCYASWEDGLKDFYRLLASKKYAGQGKQTLEEVIPKYAPPNKNNPQRYQEVVSNYIRQASNEAERKGLISLFLRFIMRK